MASRTSSIGSGPSTTRRCGRRGRTCRLPADDRSDPGGCSIGRGLAVLGVARIHRATPSIRTRSARQRLIGSTVTLVMLIVAFTWYLPRRWPMTSTRDAVVIGVAWAVLTVVFEFAFGRYVDGASWSDLLAAYKMWNGELWPLVLVVMGAAPALVADARRCLR